MKILSLLFAREAAPRQAAKTAEPVRPEPPRPDAAARAEPARPDTSRPEAVIISTSQVQPGVPAPPDPKPAVAPIEPVGPLRRTALQELTAGYDVRSLPPRRMPDLGYDLYVAGVLSDEEYAMLAFQPELHPDYDKTTGVLTGERADPDRPRDLIAVWEDRLAFEQEHNGDDQDVVARTQRILGVLKSIENPVDLLV